jgi:hypothetical protein
MMFRTTNIFIGLVTIAFWGCTPPHSADQESNLTTEGGSHQDANISIVNGRYRLDTNAILDNNNLDALMEELKEKTLTEKNTVQEIPWFVLSFLDSLTGDFSIANRDEEWQVGCTIMGKSITKSVYDPQTGDSLLMTTFDNSHPLPSRQLIYFGLGENIALFTYFTGGWGVMKHCIILQFSGLEITEFWCGYAPTDARDKADILDSLESRKGKEWGLNTNIIHL